jgi:hypothetical protein
MRALSAGRSRVMSRVDCAGMTVVLFAVFEMAYLCVERGMS